MNYNRKPKNFEEIQHDNIIIGFVNDKAIIQTEDGEFHYIEGITPEHAEVGSVVEDNCFRSIRLLTAQEQIVIMDYIEKNIRS